METMKYNARFDAALPISGAIERNGHSFRVETESGTETVSGIPVTFAKVVVTDEDGRECRFKILTGSAADPEEEK